MVGWLVHSPEDEAEMLGSTQSEFEFELLLFIDEQSHRALKSETKVDLLTSWREKPPAEQREAVPR
jgi:hypothetical protein